MAASICWRRSAPFSPLTSSALSSTELLRRHAVLIDFGAVSPRDLAVIVKRAQGTNGTTPLQEFSEQILNECIVSASK